jgi:Zn-dependent protease with chaperone function
MAVYERGGPLQTARGKGERCLILGAGLLRGMRVGSLKSVLAHEFGHFKNEDTAGGALSLAVRRSMVQMIIALAQNGAAAAYNPAWIFVTRYHQVFLRISQGASRLQEVLADRWAVFAYGSKPFVEGFEHVVTRSVEHDVRAQATLQEVIKGDLALANFYTYEAKSPIDVQEIAERVREARERPADPYDSHPPPKDRVDAATALAVDHRPEEGDDEDAWQLFEGAAELEERLTGKICEAIAENHNVFIRRTPQVAPEASA